MRTRVKICGITRPEDAVMAAGHGADAIGLNFWPPGSRCIDARAAAEIVSALPPMVTPIGVFVSPAAHEVWEVLERVGLGALQFHGDESPAECACYGVPYIKAVRVRGSRHVTRAPAHC